MCPGGALRDEAMNIYQAVHLSSTSSVLFTRFAIRGLENRQFLNTLKESASICTVSTVRISVLIPAY